jgi:hypothetical protein
MTQGSTHQASFYDSKSTECTENADARRNERIRRFPFVPVFPCILLHGDGGRLTDSRNSRTKVFASYRR